MVLGHQGGFNGFTFHHFNVLIVLVKDLMGAKQQEKHSALHVSGTLPLDPAIARSVKTVILLVHMLELDPYLTFK